MLQNNREADRKMAGIQYSLEERANLERKHKKQVRVRFRVRRWHWHVVKDRDGNEIEN